MRLRRRRSLLLSLLLSLSPFPYKRPREPPPDGHLSILPHTSPTTLQQVARSYTGVSRSHCKMLLAETSREHDRDRVTLGEGPLSTAPAIPLLLIAHPPYTEAQVGELCLIHAFNMCMQRALLDHGEMQHLLLRANVQRPLGEPALQRGQYDTGELSICLQALDPTLRWHEGLPHKGRTTGRTWTQTLAAQTFDMTQIDAVILTIHPHHYGGSSAQRGSHHVAAVHLPLVGAAPDWYILNSTAPHKVQRLSQWEVASSFDADLSFAVEAPLDSSVPGRKPLAAARVCALVRASLLLRRAAAAPSPAAQPSSRLGTAWPGATGTPTVATTALRILLWLPPSLAGSDAATRQRFQTICVQHGANVLQHADYHLRAGHLLLTVKDPLHAQQCRTNPRALQLFARDVMSWRLVFENEDASHTLSAAQCERGLGLHVDKHGFAMPRRRHGFRPVPEDAPEPAAISINPFALLSNAPEPNSSTSSPALPSQSESAAGTSVPPSNAASKRRRNGTSTQPRTPSQPGPTTPVATRRARHTIHDADHIGSWNVHDLGSSQGLARLQIISQLMLSRGVGVLAVQETKMSAASTLPAQAGLVYKGCAALRGGNGTRCKGSGFLLQAQHADSFSYLGPVAPLVDGYGAVWGRWAGQSKSSDTYVASVYMPDVGRTGREPGLFARALTQIRTGYHKFAQQPGSVRLLGDWNGRVGHCSNNAVPAQLQHLAPIYGENTVNPHGLEVLRFCEDLDLRLLSGYTPLGMEPTFRRGNASSVIDFVLVPARDYAACSRTCQTVPHTDADVVGAATDHMPVLVHCPPRTPELPKRGFKVTRVCYEHVWDDNKRAHFQSLVAAAAPAAVAAVPLYGVVPGNQAACDSAARTATRVLEDAAAQAFGTRTVVHGIRKRWMTHEVAELCSLRRHARAVHASEGTDASAHLEN